MCSQWHWTKLQGAIGSEHYNRHEIPYRQHLLLGSRYCLINLRTEVLPRVQLNHTSSESPHLAKYQVLETNFIILGNQLVEVEVLSKTSYVTSLDEFYEQNNLVKFNPTTAVGVIRLIHV